MQKDADTYDEQVHDESPMFKRHYELRSRNRSSSNVSQRSKDHVSGKNETVAGSMSDTHNETNQLPKLSKSSSNTTKGTEPQIRRGPVILRRTLSSLSIGSSSKPGNVDNRSYQDNIDEDPNDELPGLKHTSSYHSFTSKHRHHKQLKQMRDTSDSQNHNPSHPPSHTQNHSHNHKHNHNYNHNHNHNHNHNQNYSHSRDHEYNSSSPVSSSSQVNDYVQSEKNSKGAAAPSRKQSFAEALLKKFGGPGSHSNSTASSSHINRKKSVNTSNSNNSSSNNGDNNNKATSNNDDNNATDNNYGSTNNSNKYSHSTQTSENDHGYSSVNDGNGSNTSRSNDRLKGSISGDKTPNETSDIQNHHHPNYDRNHLIPPSLSSRRSSKDSISAQHIIESVPHSLRRKVSTLVHGFGHDLDNNHLDNHYPIRKIGTFPDGSDKGKHSDNSDRSDRLDMRPDVVRHHTSHFVTSSNSTLNSPKKDANTPGSKLNTNASHGQLSSSDSEFNPVNDSSNISTFQLDTNLENLSDITKLSNNSRRGSLTGTRMKFSPDINENESNIKTGDQFEAQNLSSSNVSDSDLDLKGKKKYYSNKSGTSKNSSYTKGSQQWVAPESWDVESDVEKPRVKRNIHGELMTGRSRRQVHQMKRGRTPQGEMSALSNDSQIEPPSQISRSLNDSDGFKALMDSESQDTDRFSSGTATSSDTESMESDSRTSATSPKPSHTVSSLNKIIGNSTECQNQSSQNKVNDQNDNNISLDSEGHVLSKEISADDEKHDRVEYELERYYKDFSDLDPKRHYAIRIFNTDDTFTTLSCTPTTTVRDIIPALKRKFNITSQGSYQLSLKVGKLSKILRPLAKPIIIERKLLLLNGYKKSDPLHIMGIEDLSFVFKFLFHPVAPSHLTAEQEQRLMRSDFIHVDLRAMDLTTPPIIFYQHTSEIESLDVSNNADIFLPLEFIESAIKLSSLRMVNIRASRFPSNVTEVYKLVSLELQRNFIRKVPSSISNLKNLTILNLQCNELDKLPKGFGQLGSLQLLDLSSNRFVHYPEVINSCTNLLQVNLSNNKIYTLPASVNKLKKLAKMNLSHNKLTSIADLSDMKNLRTLNLKHNRITTIKTSATNLQNLFLTDNRISDFDDNLPKLRTLEIQENPMTSISYKEFYPMSMTSLSLSKAKLSSVPRELFVKLSCLEKLDLSENNLTQMPDEISLLSKLVYLSVARNKLESLPAEFPHLKSLKSLDLHSNNIRDFMGGMEDIELTYLNISSNMFGNSILSAPFSQNISSTSKLAKTLLFFLAADNQFDDQMWPLFNCFTNLKILNLSYNNFQDISNLKLDNLTELFFSGNNLSTLSGDIVLKWKYLKTLMLNGNNLLSLPAELSQLKHLTVFDVGSNNLKYNISNYHYDWNWRDNKDLKYLNLSGNRRFDIKSSINHEIDADLSDLTVLHNLKILGLMDVTLNAAKVPDENINFRMRTTGSMINGMRYGVADTLGKRDFVSSRDVTFERFRGKDDECLICLHDGKNQNASYGHNISRLVRDIYDKILIRQLEKYEDTDDGVKKALRFSFLQLNKEVNSMLSSVDNGNDVANLTSADLLSGSCSTAVYIKGNKMFTANIGDCMAILSKNNGDFQKLTKLHAPYKRVEYERIRISGGCVNDDKLDGVVDVSRAVGFYDLLPHIHASPDISLVSLTKADEMLIVATHMLWKYMDYETACDIAREHNSEPMLAAEAMKDHAIAYGCSENLTILCLSLFKNADQQNRFNLNKNALMTRRSTFEDATLRRLQPEILPPTGNLAIVFTDIKNSTFLWELFPNAMRTAIKTHNDVMRRLLRIYGGYEVKTEGDAFMVAFPTPISSLVWCMSVQLKLLSAQWPEEITSIQDGCVILDKNGNKIYQGLSVRMGIHWGCPVPELDLVTQRMDYLGPMVNKAARVEGVADGGQITLSSDFCSEFNKIMKLHERVVKDKESLKDVYGEEFVGELIEKEIAMLESIGWVFFNHGEQKLKGLETKELLTIAYPKSLASRHHFVTEDEQTRLLNEDCLVRLRSSARKLESIVSAVSGGYIDVEDRVKGNKSYSVDDVVKNNIGLVTSEKELYAFFDHLVTRVEAYAALIKLRQVVGGGLDCYRVSDSGPAQKSIAELLEDVLARMEK
ncbi:hypothetical protein HG535_0A05370 [Zygotorulaspora mrakii]|uniref:Adenylate cyclase n=1 Tax=Zygotorulaspora mrakii TaxID=42260 RepID=A0A7H9AWC3_ZYGMR|nr:uncharacterized protein HG535_0A05370 [Zygotorulaspora mrakii]QLG70596.1 hypothetical protein HG535_0A05370 [Zygotorulaspora mrakii]